MQKFARIVDGVVQEIVDLPSTHRDILLDEHGQPALAEDGSFQYVDRPLTLSDVFPPELASQMRPASEDVDQGWLYDGKRFSAPVIPEPTPFDPGPIVLPAAIFFDRLTEEEAGALDEVMQRKSIKFRGAWNGVAAGSDLRSDSDVWALLATEAKTLFGKERADLVLSRLGPQGATATTV